MQMKQYLSLIRFYHPIGTGLLLWPALWAIWLASYGHPPVRITIVFIVGVIIMRAAGCVINDLVDYRLDSHVLRTKNRPLAAGTLSIKSAVLVLIFLLSLALLLVYQLNMLSFYYATIGLLLALSYPWLKRVTYFPQVGLGLAFSWSIPMVFAAIHNTVGGDAWLLFASAALWPVAYDTWYAMADRDDDVKIGIKSTAILFGRLTRLIVGVLQIFFLLCLALVGWVFKLHLIYYASLCLVACCFVYQQYLVEKNISEQFLRAFRNNNIVGLLIFCGIALSYTVQYTV